MREIARRAAKAAIRFAPVLRGRGAGLVPVLRYHSIDATGSCISTRPDVFRSHLRFLSRRGLRAVSLRDHAALPPDQAARTVVVTFDDGFRNNHTEALPALREHGGTATFYVVPGYAGQEPIWTHKDLADALRKGVDVIDDWEAFQREADLDDAYVASHLPTLHALGKERCLHEYFELARTRRFRLLDWNEIRGLHEAGMEIGSHTLHHCHLSDVGEAVRDAELRGSKALLEERLGFPVEAFCYPYGNVPEGAPDAVRSAGYTTATTCVRGFQAPGGDPFRMPRLEMEPVTESSDLAFWLLPGHRGLLQRLLR